MSQTTVKQVTETEAGYGQIFAILLRQKLWFIGVFCLVFAVSTVRAIKYKPTYQSSLQLLVEPTYKGKQQGGTDEQFTDSNVQIDNSTQLALMQSSQLLHKAVELLKVKYPYISVQDIKDSLYVNQIILEENKKGETKIFEVHYSGNNPQLTRDVLRAMQQVYLEYNREQQRQRLVRGLAFINEQLPKMRQGVSKDEASLEQFRRNQSLIDPESQSQALSAEINRIQQERRTNQVQYRETYARYQALQKQLPASLPQSIVASRLNRSTFYQNLLNELQKIDLELAKQRVRFTDDNPLIQSLLTQRQDLILLLNQEGKKVVINDPKEANLDTQNLENNIKIVDNDVSRVNSLLDIQVNLEALLARDRILAQTEQQLRSQLNQFPQLLAEYARLQSEMAFKRETLQQLEKARQDLSLEIARGGFEWQVVEEPQLGQASPPPTKKNILIGSVVGLMLGSVAAFMFDQIDDSIHDAEQLKQLAQLHFLGEIPQTRRSERSTPIVKIIHSDRRQLTPLTVQILYAPSTWDALDLVYQNIQLHNSGITLNSIAITSSQPEEGKSSLALGLALSAARLNKRVLLIDANLRSPSLHKILNLPNTEGLATFLETNLPLPIINYSRSSDLCIDILTAGTPTKETTYLLSSPRMKDVMATFQESYDLVLLNVPPILGSVDALLATSLCQGSVFVARVGQVTKSNLAKSLEIMSKSKLFGLVINLKKRQSLFNFNRKQSTKSIPEPHSGEATH